METLRSFEHTDRYQFDWKLCTAAKGWAQIDTEQDASYYGTWANPEKLMIVSYVEGDITIQTASNTAEFAEEIRKIKEWNESHGWKFFGIDAFCNETITRAFEAAGLSDLLH